MKHWGELTDLETAIIRVGEFKNLFKLLVAGTENYVDIKVLQSAIYTMEGMIDDIDSTLYENSKLYLMQLGTKTGKQKVVRKNLHSTPFRKNMNSKANGHSII